MESLRTARFAFVDVETTGIDPSRDRVVEVAVLVIEGGVERAVFSSLVDPERPIPATASAIHHLTERETRGAPKLAEVLPQLRTLCADATLVAHNARFDLSFLPALRERPTICSLRLATHVLPDAPAYGNQVLRYHLGIPREALGEATPHRALADVRVTSLVFPRLVERYLAASGSDDLAALIAFAAAPTQREEARHSSAVA
ncbi:MAG: 3'-5' exonuclease [Vulcanimicrobiaceae bacterium]